MIKVFLVEGPMVLRLLLIAVTLVLFVMLFVKLIHIARNEFPGNDDKAKK